MHDDDTDASPALVRNRAVDIVVALLFIAGSAVVILDSLRIGVGWIEGQGPAPGYFPFYIAVFMAIASLVNLYAALAKRDGQGAATFVSRIAIWRVLAVLLPSIAYVTLIEYLGIYVASAIFLAGFMMAFGRENPLKAVAVGIGVPLAFFVLFERWFLVPLPKGPLEAMLGF